MSARSDHKAALHPRPAVLVWGTVNPHFLVEESNQEGTLGGGEPHSPTDAIEMLDLGGMKAQPFGLQEIPEGLGSVPHLGGTWGVPKGQCGYSPTAIGQPHCLAPRYGEEGLPQRFWGHPPTQQVGIIMKSSGAALGEPSGPGLCGRRGGGIPRILGALRTEGVRKAEGAPQRCGGNPGHGGLGLPGAVGGGSEPGLWGGAGAPRVIRQRPQSPIRGGWGGGFRGPHTAGRAALTAAAPPPRCAARPTRRPRPGWP